MATLVIPITKMAMPAIDLAIVRTKLPLNYMGSPNVI